MCRLAFICYSHMVKTVPISLNRISLKFEMKRCISFRVWLESSQFVNWILFSFLFNSENLHANKMTTETVKPDFTLITWRHAHFITLPFLYNDIYRCKNINFQIKKNLIFFLFLLKNRLWVHVRTATVGWL